MQCSGHAINLLQFRLYLALEFSFFSESLTVYLSPRMEFDFDAIEEEDSPFPEVRASVSNIDDPDMPALTMRMWFVGLFLCMISRYVTKSLSSLSLSPLHRNELTKYISLAP